MSDSKNIKNFEDYESEMTITELKTFAKIGFILYQLITT